MLTWLPLVIIVLYLLRGSCQMVYAYLMRSAGIKLVRDTRIRLYEHLLHLPVSALGSETSGKMISRILNDAGILRSLVGTTLLTLFKEIPTIIVLLGVAFYRVYQITGPIGREEKERKKIRKIIRQEWKEKTRSMNILDHI